jgi:chemotaxis response regulator CheB
MYCDGEQVDRDTISAYMWYLISEQFTEQIRTKISNAKRKLAESLTTEEILEAQQRASERLKQQMKSTPTISRVASVGGFNSV